MDVMPNCTKSKIKPKQRQTWKVSAQFYEFGLDSWFFTWIPDFVFFYHVIPELEEKCYSSVDTLFN